MEPDFEGWATKSGLVCSDGRTIGPEAFQHQDGETVPLVWEHRSGDPENVLGHAVLYHRDGGMWVKAYFNKSERAKHTLSLVHHGDVRSLSIAAGRLVEKSKTVLHGVIREVSLVLKGANPGATIQNFRLVHSDGEEEIMPEEAIIYSGEELAHSDKSEDSEGEETLLDVYNSMTEKQQNVLLHMVEQAMATVNHSDSGEDDPDEDEEQDEDSEEDSEDENDDENSTEDSEENDDEDASDLNHKEGSQMSGNTRNVFDRNGKQLPEDAHVLTHSDVQSIIESAKQGGSMKEAVEEYALKHSIENIGLLFPEAKLLEGNRPEWVTRPKEWVSKVLGGTRKSPFSRIKSAHATLTEAEARAKGYITGSQKKEQVFPIMRRATTPQTIYKRQGLDRDDIIDITDFDVVAWLKEEMRVMLNEELARAVILGDGREIDDPDKIDPEHIRPIAFDNNFYAHHVQLAPDVQGEALVEAVLRARRHYRGSGRPIFITSVDAVTEMLLARDANEVRYYKTEAELTAALRVSEIVEVELFDEEAYSDIVGIKVNMTDYTIGADKGGEVTFFDDFNIDYNKHQYLIESRCSGTLTKYKSALVFRRDAYTGGEAPHTNAMPFQRGSNNPGTVTSPGGMTTRVDVQGEPEGQGDMQDMGVQSDDSSARTAAQTEEATPTAKGSKSKS